MIESEQIAAVCIMACTVLIGVDFILSIQLLQLQHIDMFLTIALSCFAWSMPLFVPCLTYWTKKRNNTNDAQFNRFMIFTVINSIIVLIGLSLVFFHMSTIAGCIFIASILVAFFIPQT